VARRDPHRRVRSRAAAMIETFNGNPTAEMLETLNGSLASFI